jgi:hypothetical protein
MGAIGALGLLWLIIDISADALAYLHFRYGY